MIIEENKIVAHIDSIAKNCKYKMLFLTLRKGASYYDFPLLHSFFQNLVLEALKKGLKIGLQLWGNYQDKSIEGSQRMIGENEVVLDQSGNAKFTAMAKYIRLPGRLLKSDLFKVGHLIKQEMDFMILQTYRILPKNVNQFYLIKKRLKLISMVVSLGKV